MNVLLYSAEPTETEERIIDAVQGVVSVSHIEVHRTAEDLSRRLSRFRHDSAVAVLVAENKADLLGLASKRDMFDDMRIILVAPDWEKDTLDNAHRLFPRYLTHCASDFKDVAAVLEKMISYMRCRTGAAMGGEENNDTACGENGPGGKGRCRQGRQIPDLHFG